MNRRKELVRGIIVITTVAVALVALAMAIDAAALFNSVALPIHGIHP